MGKKSVQAIERATGVNVNHVQDQLRKSGKGGTSGDPFGGEAIAAEQDARFDKALASIEGKKLETDTSTTNTVDTQSSNQTIFDPKSKVEQGLTDDSIAAYEAQQGLVQNQMAGIDAREGVQGGARDTLGDVFSGDAFNLSNSEEMRINRLRDANIGASSNAVNELLTQRLAEVEADAARRGLRGQAFSQLQGDAIGSAATELNRATLDANQLASQQAISMPGQRVGVQAGAAQGMADFADLLEQQAITNQNLLQDPIALQQARDERLKGGKQVQTNTGSTTVQTSQSSDIDPSGLLQAKAQAPGKKASKVAANQATAGTGLSILPSFLGASG